MNNDETILLAIGNSGREDDGLGWVFADAIQQESHFAGQIFFRYQLQIEDAELVRRARQVIFVDAFQGPVDQAFLWQPCLPKESFEFTTHALHPSAVLYLCHDLYGKLPKAHLLLIRGCQWGLGLGISPGAKKNLDETISFFAQLLEDS